MDDMIAKQVNNSGSAVFLLQSGLEICLNPDCKVQFNNITTVSNNTNTTTENYDDKNSLPLIVGSTAGVLCGISVLLLIIVTLICSWTIYRRYVYLT